MAAHTSNVRKITNFKIYTTWAHILSDRNVFAPRRGGNGGVQYPRGFSCYPAVRTGSSNTLFFRGFFFGGHLPQTSGFRSAKEILFVSFATQPRAFILSDLNIFYSPARPDKYLPCLLLHLLGLVS